MHTICHREQESDIALSFAEAPAGRHSTNPLKVEMYSFTVSIDVDEALLLSVDLTITTGGLFWQVFYQDGQR
jgi:hypothetical protein